MQTGPPSCQDVFVRDRLSGATERESVSSTGEQGNDDSGMVAITPDGRYAAFDSYASNLVPGDTAQCPGFATPRSCNDVFARDRQTGTTTRVSVSSTAEQGNDGSWWPSISDDGRYVAFASAASNLVPGDTNGFEDVFVHDVRTGKTERASVSTAGLQGDFPSSRTSISANGRYVAFWSSASNLVPGDANNTWDVFVHDMATGRTTLESVTSSGQQQNGLAVEVKISADGRYVAFTSAATNLDPRDTNNTDDAYVHDRVTGQTTLVSILPSGQAAGGVDDTLSISGDGRYVGFASSPTLLDSQAFTTVQQVYVRDRVAGATALASVSSSGQPGDQYSIRSSVSDDGSAVSFLSFADNLVPGDTNGATDVFVRQLGWGGTCGNGTSEDGLVSAPVHNTVEPLTGPLQPTVHGVNCAVVVPLGL